jgi:NAD(P)-dependent dehydrogenase (short-subunit alcohol dehydrogenase family)
MTGKYLAGIVEGVTGGASGMGLATAIALARAGADGASLCNREHTGEALLKDPPVRSREGGRPDHGPLKCSR